MKLGRWIKMDSLERIRLKVAQAGLEIPGPGPSCGLGAGEQERAPSLGHARGRATEMGHGLFHQAGPNEQ